MPSWQRATLGVLAVLVMVATGLALVVTLNRGDDVPTAAEPSTTLPVETTVASTTTITETTSTRAPTTTTTIAETTTTTTAETTTTTRPDPLLVLKADGVDHLVFGDAAVDVLAVLEALLGEPDDDTGWVDQMQNYGVCLGEVRFVRWGSFQVFFTDGPSDWAPAGVRHFASYTQAGVFDGEILDMVTEDGLSLGSPVGDVRAIHGEEAVYDDDLYGPVFVHDPPGPAQLWGSVSGLAPDDVIESITGSYACGE